MICSFSFFTKITKIYNQILYWRNRWRNRNEITFLPHLTFDVPSIEIIEIFNFLEENSPMWKIFCFQRDENNSRYFYWKHFHLRCRFKSLLSIRQIFISVVEGKIAAVDRILFWFSVVCVWTTFPLSTPLPSYPLSFLAAPFSLELWEIELWQKFDKSSRKNL